MNMLLGEYEWLCASGNARRYLLVCLNKFKKNFPWRSKYPIFLTERRIDNSKKNTNIDNNCHFPYVPREALIWILRLENVSLGTLETFESQGCMSENLVFHEIKKIFEKMPKFCRYFEYPPFFKVPQNVLMEVATDGMKNLRSHITSLSRPKKLWKKSMITYCYSKIPWGGER